MSTEWVDIVGFDGLYCVNANGVVVGQPVNKIRSDGKPLILPRRELRFRIDANGYQVVGLTLLGKKFTKKVHRLVACAFLPNPNNLPQVNHINGVKFDNRLENLEWCDNSRNQKHAYEIGLQPKRTSLRGALHPGHVLRSEDVVSIVKRVKDGEKQKDLAAIYGVSKSLISQIANLKKRAHEHIF